MKKTIFRVTLLKGSDDLCDKVVILSAKKNGGQNLTLNDLKIMVEGNKIEWPLLYSKTNAEIVCDNELRIDKKINDKWETVCIIEEVEILDLPIQDIPEELFQSN